MAESDDVKISSGTSPFWQNLGAATTIFVAVAGLIGSGFGYFAKVEADNNAALLDKESQNIKVLQQKFAEAETFAGNIAQGRDAMSRNNADIKAMIEYVSLYAASDTLDRKYLLVETAQAAKDSLSLQTLGTIMSHDDDIQHPSSADTPKAREIKETLKTAVSEAYNRGTPRNVSANFNDARLGAVVNPVAAANGQVVAALTQVGLFGWVFIGDVVGGTDGPLIGDLVRSSAVPKIRTQVTTRAALNIRTTPPSKAGQLGEIVGVAPAGSVLDTDEVPRRFAFISHARNGEKREAVWIYVRLHTK